MTNWWAIGVSCVALALCLAWLLHLAERDDEDDTEDPE
jgi:hypothetical protein